MVNKLMPLPAEHISKIIRFYYHRPLRTCICIILSFPKHLFISLPSLSYVFWITVIPVRNLIRVVCVAISKC